MKRLSLEVQTISEIVKLSDFQKSKFFTFFEIVDSNNISLAGKLAAKKAFLKCLECDKSGYLPYDKIEVKRPVGKRPSIEVSDSLLLEKLSNQKISLSISHIKDIAIAVCIVYNK
ncbi:hypothetical protein M0P98_09245 [bacterium]|nr:hypothetical protein [bacterium]